MLLAGYTKIGADSTVPVLLLLWVTVVLLTEYAASAVADSGAADADCG